MAPPVCMICKAFSPGFCITWPGSWRTYPKAFADLKRALAEKGRHAHVRLCEPDGECAAQAIASMVRRVGVDFPFSDGSRHLEPRVREILGRPPAEPRRADPPAPPQPSPPQGALL